MENLTKQDQEFVKEVAITGNQTKSAQKAYGIDDPNYAGVKATKLLRKDKIATAVEEVKRTLAERIPDDLVADRHIALLNKVDDKGELDINAVKAGVDMAYKLKGSYAPDKRLNLNLNSEVMPTEDIEAIANKLNEIARSNNRPSIPSDGIDSNVVDGQV